jgi:hypothetical protein
MLLCISSYSTEQIELSFGRKFIFFPLMSNEVDTQNDINSLTHITEWIIYGW